jgi:hypothetical protein
MAAPAGPYPSELLDRLAAYLASPMHQEAEINRALFRAVAAELYPLPSGNTITGLHNLNSLWLYGSTGGS